MFPPSVLKEILQWHLYREDWRVLLPHLYFAHDLLDREHAQTLPGGDVDLDPVVNVRPPALGLFVPGLPAHMDAVLPVLPLLDAPRFLPLPVRSFNVPAHRPIQ